MTNLNRETLITIANEDQESKVFMEYLAKRERHRGDLDVKSIARRLGISVEGVERTLNKLKPMHVGEYIDKPGRRRKFHFTINPVRIGQTYKPRERAPREYMVETAQRPDRQAKVTIRKDGIEIETAIENINSVVKYLNMK